MYTLTENIHLIKSSDDIFLQFETSILLQDEDRAFLIINLLKPCKVALMNHKETATRKHFRRFLQFIIHEMIHVMLPILLDLIKLCCFFEWSLHNKE